MPGEEQTIRLYQDFKRLKTYREKLEFYDAHFGCIPVGYPFFDIDLNVLYDQKQYEYFCGLFERERRKAIVLERRFDVLGQEYIFNVTPVNSNTLILNDFILYRFMDRDIAFTQAVHDIKELAHMNPDAVWTKWLGAQHKIESIESKLLGGEERGLRYRFMNAFINGYNDEKGGLLKKFYNRRKFIELYLYAQGVLFRKYFQQLHDICDYSATKKW